jgi:hypothetical protein
MADQTFRFSEGIAKDVNVQIKDHYVPTDFMVLDMGEEEHDPPIILGRSFLNTTQAIIYMRNEEVHFQFPSKKVHCYFNSYTNCDQSRKNRSRRRRHAYQCHQNQSLMEEEGERYYYHYNKEKHYEEEGPKKDDSPTSTLSLSAKQV